MILCKTCSILMVSVMSFLNDKHEKFYCCPKCRGETKHQRIKDEELNFGEVLDRQIYKIK